jgi:hypothetical protein
VADPDITRTLKQSTYTTEPYQFYLREQYNEYSSYLAEWCVQASNQADSVIRCTHSIEGIGQVPLVTDVRFQSDGAELTFSWKVALDANVDQASIQIFDHDTRDCMWSSVSFPASNQSFTLPSGILQLNHPYTVRIIIFRLDQSRQATSRSETYFDFTPTSVN